MKGTGDGTRRVHTKTNENTDRGRQKMVKEVQQILVVRKEEQKMSEKVSGWERSTGKRRPEEHLRTIMNEDRGNQKKIKGVQIWV